VALRHLLDERHERRVGGQRPELLRFNLRSISGMIRCSIAGMWTFIIQSAQSIDSGAHGSLRWSCSDSRARPPACWSSRRAR
jgi:hypothetical protein